ncbi:hypothetical protein [Aestuariivirga sp.]|uniref:hypothetical protein n=1 Tax=Aestuariivirga sp. TaxID=2650926 RepID=UPI003BACDB4C
MKSIIIIFNGQPNLNYMATVYSAQGRTSIQSPKRLVVEGEWGWFAIDVDAELEADFSESERDQITRVVPEPIFAQMPYSNSFSANLAVELMPTTAETLIDNDHGMLLRINEVREMIHAGKEWQTAPN